MDFKKIVKEWKKPLMLLFFVILVALGFRLYNLSYLPVFGDEAIYVRWSQVMRNEPTLRFLPLSDGKQPLFMWVLMFIVNKLSDPLVVGRLISVGTGIVTLLGIYVLSYLLFKSKKLSLVSSFLFAIAPFSVFFDRLALTDSMLSMFGIWTFVFAIQMARYKRLDYAMLAGFSLGGAFLTKSPALYFALLFPSVWIFTNWKRKNAIRTLVIAGLLTLVVYAVAFAMYNILRLGPNFNMLSSRNLDYVYPLSHIFSHPFDPFLPFVDRIIEYFWLMGPGSLLILAVVGIYVNIKKHYQSVLFLLIAFGLPILASAEFSKTMTARYVYFSLPYLVILAASTINGTNKKLTKLIKLIMVAGILISLWINLMILTNIEKAPLPRSERSGFLEEWTAGTGIKEVAERLIQIRKETPPEKEIIVGTEGYFGTLPDGLQIYLQDVPGITVVGVGVNLVELPDELISSYDYGNPTYLVINNSRIIGNPEKMDLELLAAYPKAFRPEWSDDYKHKGPREVLYFFEVNQEKPHE